MQKKSYNPWIAIRLWWIRRQFDKRKTKAQRKVFKLLDRTLYKKFKSPGRVV